MIDVLKKGDKVSRRVEYMHYRWRKRERKYSILKIDIIPRSSCKKFGSANHRESVINLEY